MLKRLVMKAGIVAGVMVALLATTATAKTAFYNFGPDQLEGSVYYSPRFLELVNIAPNPDQSFYARFSVTDGEILDVNFLFSYGGGDYFYDPTLPQQFAYGLAYYAGSPGYWEYDIAQGVTCTTGNGCVTPINPHLSTATLSGAVTLPSQYPCGPSGTLICGPRLDTCYNGGGCGFFGGHFDNIMYADILDVGPNFSATLELTEVPEPSAWALMIFGFGAIGAALRSRRRAVFIR